MTQEDKELLLKDLSARLSYGVKLQCGGVLIGKTHQRYMKERCDAILYSITEVYDNCYAINARYDLIEVKPYLRPMSSMTEEERKEAGVLIKENRPGPYGIINNEGVDNLFFSVSITSTVLIDWLNAHHFDYRGLIPKGLAIEATEGMYNIKE